MSSRLMPPKVGSSALTMRTISSGSVASISMSKTSTSAKRLKSRPLPSITGLPARAPTLPRPSTALPVLTPATRVPAGRVLERLQRVLVDLPHRLGHPRRVGQGEVALCGAGLGQGNGDLAGATPAVVFERVLAQHRHRTSS